MIAPGGITVVCNIQTLQSDNFKQWKRVRYSTCDSLQKFCTISQSSGSTQSLDSESSALLDSLALITKQHGGGGRGKALQTQDWQVLMVDLFLLSFLRQHLLSSLDTGQDPGLSLISSVGSNTKTHLLRMSVSLIISCKLKHFNWRSLSNIIEPAGITWVNTTRNKLF